MWCRTHALPCLVILVMLFLTTATALSQSRIVDTAETTFGGSHSGFHRGAEQLKSPRPSAGSSTWDYPHDTPYIQDSAELFLFASSSPIANWTTLPISVGSSYVKHTDTITDMGEVEVDVGMGAKRSQMTDEYGVGGVIDIQTWNDVLFMHTTSSILCSSALPNITQVYPSSSSTSFNGTTARMLVSGDVLLIVSPTSITSCPLDVGVIGSNCTSFVHAFGSAITALHAINVDVPQMGGDVFVGTENAAFYVPSNLTSSMNITSVTGDGAVTAITTNATLSSPPYITVYISTQSKLWYYVSGGYNDDGREDSVSPSSLGGIEGRWYFYRTPGIIDATPTGLSFDADGTLWIVNSICVNLLYPNQTFSRVGGMQGLPTPNLTSVIVANSGIGNQSGSRVWIGSKQGVVTYSTSELSAPFPWRYLYGSRFLPGLLPSPGQTVLALASMSASVSWSGDNTVIVLTDNGISVITEQVWTLAEKAEHYQSMIYPRHDRFGLCTQVALSEYGDLSNYTKESGANDGLWTSTYVVSQAFRYAVTKDPQAKADCWRAFEGMELLNNVTGIKGLMARSVLNQTESPGGADWYNSSSMPGWIWNGNTSSDEVTGHFFAYPVVYDLVAETPEEKARVYALIYDITYYIVSNNFYLIDVTGKRTQWGVWNPTYLNDNPSWYDDRGVNSLQMLTYLVSAHRISGDLYFLAAINLLIDQYGYAENIVDAKITQPSDVNFSDDELTFLPYFSYLWNKPEEYFSSEFNKSITRTWNYNQILHERSSLWNIIFGVSQGGDPSAFRMDDAMFCLRNWPLSQIDWPTDNSNRLDYFLLPGFGRGHSTQSIKTFPYDEGSMFLWNTDPYQLSGGSGYIEFPASAWLLPYWMGRYFGFINPT
eukprot:TRINITY_DN11154_c0_g1_i1.p1 TRINITY_DN11154_c0_g1~~TRINITY_DN11154_c0_g1_i1.p1  ORF type:complete len:881 (+),score=128.69 TRINITY_DN11154_c0_g1_i1:2-2644(+)